VGLKVLRPPSLNPDLTIIDWGLFKLGDRFSQISTDILNLSWGWVRTSCRRSSAAGYAIKVLMIASDISTDFQDISLPEIL
jgi:hypothetical protein